MSAGSSENDAHVELISSDGVGFQVHSWLLKGYSNLLREALESPVIGPEHKGNRPVIAFADREFENSRTLACVLDLFLGKTDPPSLSKAGDCHRIQKVFQFLRKWECGTTIRLLVSHVSHMVHLSNVTIDNPGRLLLGAVVLEDVEFVCTIISRTGHYSTPGDAEDHPLPHLRPTPLESYLNPVHMPFEHRAALPQAYHDALAMSIHEMGSDARYHWRTIDHWSEVADRFRHHLPVIQAAERSYRQYREGRAPHTSGL